MRCSRSGIPQNPFPCEDSCVQEGLDQAKNPFIADASAHPAHQGRVVDLVEARCDIGLEDPLVARPGVVEDVLDGVLSPPTGTEPVRRGAEAGFEDRLEHQLQCGLDHPVPGRRDAQTTQLPIGLGDHALAYGQRDEGPVLQVGAYSGQEPDHAACGRLDPRGGPAVDPGCSRPFVRSDPAPRHREERRIRHEVVQVIEHAARISRGPVVKLGLNTQYPPLRLLRVGPLDPTRSVGGAADAAIPRRVSCHFLSCSHRLTAVLPHVGGVTALGVLRPLRPTRAPWADSAPAHYGRFVDRPQRAGPEWFPCSLRSGPHGRDPAIPRRSPRRPQTCAVVCSQRLDAARSGGLLIETARPAPHSRPPSTRFETVLANEASDTGSSCIPS